MPLVSAMEMRGLSLVPQRSDGDFGWCRLNQVHTVRFSLTTSAPAYLGQVNERRGSFSDSDLIERKCPVLEDVFVNLRLDSSTPVVLYSGLYRTTVRSSRS